MGKYISDLEDFTAAIELLEVLEIETDNKHIKELQNTAQLQLREILRGVEPDWMIHLLKKARQKVVG